MSNYDPISWDNEKPPACRYEVDEDSWLEDDEDSWLEDDEDEDDSWLEDDGSDDQVPKIEA